MNIILYEEGEVAAKYNSCVVNSINRIYGNAFSFKRINSNVNFWVNSDKRFKYNFPKFIRAFTVVTPCEAAEVEKGGRGNPQCNDRQLRKVEQICKVFEHISGVLWVVLIVLPFFRIPYVLLWSFLGQGFIYWYWYF